MKKLTQAIIDEALPPEKEIYLWDNQIRGLGCRIRPSGLKVYYYRYTSPVDKIRKKIKVGDAKILNLDDARNIARKYAIETYDHQDPMLNIKKQNDEQKKSILYKDFWIKFEKEYIEKKHEESTMRRNKINIKRILNFFGHIPLDEIKGKHVIDFRNTIDSNANLNICLSYLKNSFKHAELCELRPTGSNPCLNIKGYGVNKRERYLSRDELSKLVDCLKEKIKIKGGRSVYPYYALLMLIYTGQRREEILQLKWENIDYKQKILTIIKHKTDKKIGKKVIPINEEVLAILKKIPKKEGNPYIFCGENLNSFTKQINDVWLLIRIKLNIEDVRIHDLRHSFASFAINNGIDLYTISKLLGHSNINTTQRYAHLMNDTLKEASNKIFK